MLGLGLKVAFKPKMCLTVHPSPDGHSQGTNRQLTFRRCQDHSVTVFYIRTGPASSQFPTNTV